VAQQKVTFTSDGLELAGILHRPRALAKGEKRPAFLVLHGFGTSKEGATPRQAAEILERLGYIVLRFDMRGCGESGGARAWILCQDQVRDTSNALTWLARQPGVDGKRIGVFGHSFGAAVAVYAGGIDERIAAVIGCGSWGDGVSKFREQHPSPAQWKRFISKLEEGRRHRQRTGRSLMIPRFSIVPIPPAQRKNLAGDWIKRFPAETAMSMMDFRANDVVGLIAPRPLLLLHPALDTTTPTSQAIGLFQHAKQPCDLHLVSGVDHFMLSDDTGVVRAIMSDWLGRYLPVRKPAKSPNSAKSKSSPRKAK
jgi:pimeloyl-ACP methyl ester carboxylesterase